MQLLYVLGIPTAIGSLIAAIFLGLQSKRKEH
jgi:hypothetical protein